MAEVLMKKKTKEKTLKKKEVWIPLVIAVVGIILVLAIMIPVKISKQKKIEAENLRLARGRLDYTGALEFNIEEFVIPDEFRGDRQPQLLYYRSMLAFWDESIVERFLVNPDSIAEDILRKQADNDVRSVFADVK
jgi:hypothetical protein